MKLKKKFGFTCEHCGSWVSKDKFIGTHFRNHCPFCLWSRHVDLKKSGDRLSHCYGQMKPIGFIFKKEGFDKYGQPRQGELMLIHLCQDCGKISINRLAADDNDEMILKVFEDSQNLDSKLKQKLNENNIRLLDKSDEQEIRIQLFGKI